MGYLLFEKQRNLNFGTGSSHPGHFTPSPSLLVTSPFSHCSEVCKMEENNPPQKKLFFFSFPEISSVELVQGLQDWKVKILYC